MATRRKSEQPEVTETPAATKRGKRSLTPEVPATPAATPARGKKAAPASTPMIPPIAEGMLSLADVAGKLGVDPRIARQRLRAAYPDHEGRWAFDPKKAKELSAYESVIVGPKAA